MDSVLARIMDELKLKKASQRQLTAYLGLSSCIFTQWKNGTTTSYMKYLPRIAEYLGVTESYLLHGQRSVCMEADEREMVAWYRSANGIKSESRSLSPEEQALLNHYREITPEEQAFARQLRGFLKKKVSVRSIPWKYEKWPL